ncbi:hypothetical protein AAVH_07043 [Aphelenchoides avenae]|nr:hypothetical protein AAVH_07043 [Aphelenchus avenae]
MDRSLEHEHVAQYHDLIGDLSARILDEVSNGHMAAVTAEAGGGENQPEDGGEAFVVRAVVGAMFQDNTLMLAVDWEGFGYATWEPMLNCVGADIRIVEFIDTLLHLL